MLYAVQIAGCSLHERYRRQFVKLLNFIQDKWLKQNMVTEDASASAAVSRLTTYISTKRYLMYPESLRMPAAEESLTIHA